MMRIVAIMVAALLGTSSVGGTTGSICPGAVPSLPVNGHGLIHAVAAVDDLVVTIDQRGITTWSIADPTNPEQLGFLEVAPEWLEDGRDARWSPNGFDLLIHPSGDWACVFPTFDCFDLRDPARPSPYRWHLDDWPCESYISGCSFSKRVAWTGETLAVGRNDDEIWLLDISDNRPQEWIRPPAWADRFDGIASLTFAGDVLIVLEYYTALSAWDLTDPNNPIEIGTGTLDSGSYYGFRLRGHPRGAVAIGSGYWPTGIVAISTTHLPELGSVNLSDELEWNFVERLQFVGDRGAARMVRFDPATGHYSYHFAQLRIAAPFLLLEESAVEADSEFMALTSDHIIGAPGGSHLEVYTLGDELRLDASTPSVGEALDFAADGGIGVVANGAAGVTVLDLADPERPTVLADLEIEDRDVLQVEMRGAIAYILTDGGVGTVNLARPRAPSLMTHREIDNVCCELELAGDLAFVGSLDECTMFVLDVSNPSHLIKTAETLFCDPDSRGERADRIHVVGDLAYVDSWTRLDIVDVSNPWFPEVRFNLSDRDLKGTYPNQDSLFVSHTDDTRLCQIIDGQLIVGRVYDDLPSQRLGSPGADLVAVYDYRVGHRLVDFSDLIDPIIYEVPLADVDLPTGQIVDSAWIRPFRHRLDVVSLECRPPEASFRWAGARLGIWFEDTTAYQVTERVWDFGDGSTATARAPFHEFAAPGLYVVTLTVSSANGTDSASRIVDLRDVQGHGGSGQSSWVD